MNEEFEAQLRKALQRESAPPDFLQTVLARTTASNVVPWWRRRVAVMAMAAGVILGAVVPSLVIEQRRQARAENAHRQLVEALRITHNKLVWTKQKLERKHS